MMRVLTMGVAAAFAIALPPQGSLTAEAAEKRANVQKAPMKKGKDPTAYGEWIADVERPASKQPRGRKKIGE